jgi:hypothetical protein
MKYEGGGESWTQAMAVEQGAPFGDISQFVMYQVAVQLHSSVVSAPPPVLTWCLPGLTAGPHRVPGHGRHLPPR